MQRLRQNLFRDNTRKYFYIKCMKQYIPYIYFLLVVAIIAAASNATGQAGSTNIKLPVIPHQWVRTNPGGGGAFGTAGASVDGVIYVGSDLSGVYRSTDRGQSWQPLGARQGLFATHISGLGFDSRDGSVLYIGTDHGIYRSADGGESFTQTLDSGYVTDIKINAGNPAVGYAAWHPDFNVPQGEILRTTDHGLTWKHVSENLPEGLWILKLVVDPKNVNTLYLLSGAGRFTCGPAVVYRSIDAGVTWQQLAPELNTIMDLAVDPRNPWMLYVTTMNASCNAPDYWSDLDGSIYKSEDYGDSWSRLADRTGVIWLKWDAPDTLRLIDPREPFPWNPDAGVWQSGDAGRTWQHVGKIDYWDYGYQGEAYRSYGTAFDGIVHTLGEDLSDPESLFWVNGQWVFGTDDGGKTFNNLFTKEITKNTWRSRGIDNVNMLDLAISEADPQRIYLGYFDLGFWRSDDGGTSWRSGNDSAFTGDWEGFGGNVAAIVADPQRIDMVWATFSGHQNGEHPTYLVRSNKGGEKGSWQLANSGLPTVQVMGLSLDVNSTVNRRTLFVTAEGDVYRSTNDGLDWQKVDDCNGCRVTAVDRFDGNLVYAGGEIGLRRSTDGGNSWQDMGIAEMRGDTAIGFWDYDWEGVFDIKTDPHHRSWVYVTAFGKGRGLYHSKDSGISWQKLWTDDFMRSVAISPETPDLIYATSSNALEAGGYDVNSHGVLVSTDGGINWSDAGDGMAWPFAVPVEISGDGWVFAGSPGTGFQKAKIPTATSVNENHPQLIDGFVLYQNFPNPFNPKTTIRFHLNKNSVVEVRIYDTLGKTIRTLLRDRRPAGTYTLVWDGRNDAGNLVSSAIYYVKLKVDNWVTSRKMVMTK